ncbi:MAG: hypothetical protein KY460_03495 [Actinobacteria bacterium]|nr:hypothetical protein [Actinomycetota bacterium]
MDVWVIVVVIALCLVAVAAYLGMRSRRANGSRRLKQQFGDEYERTVAQTSDRTAAEQELERRVERHERLDITKLSDEERERYANEWRDVQRRFVDEPERTLGDADRLITQAMRDRGYPTEHYDQKIEDLSVEHAATLDAYREAHDITERHERDGVSTDELRRAMQRYRAIFEDIVETRTTTKE